MNEEHFREIEKVLLYVSDAQERAPRAGERISKAGAEPHLVNALDEAASELSALHRRLMQGTYWAVPGAERLAV